jgi:hypothetical protein
MTSCYSPVTRGVMRCIACGAELRSAQSKSHNITIAPSDENCWCCEDRARSSRESPSATEPEPLPSAPSASLRPAEPVSVSTTPRTFVPPEDDLHKCEILRRAIEMVRGSTRWSQPTRSLTDRMPGRSLSSRVVHIHHDASEATYVATDAKSGLRVLRHRDHTQLRAICDRIGWQVIETDRPSRTEGI